MRCSTARPSSSSNASADREPRHGRSHRQPRVLGVVSPGALGSLHGDPEPARCGADGGRVALRRRGLVRLGPDESSARQGQPSHLCSLAGSRIACSDHASSGRTSFCPGSRSSTRMMFSTYFYPDRSRAVAGRLVLRCTGRSRAAATALAVARRHGAALTPARSGRHRHPRRHAALPSPGHAALSLAEQPLGRRHRVPHERPSPRRPRPGFQERLHVQAWQLRQMLPQAARVAASDTPDER